ncbi:hypothetical protein HK100_005182 [Physocladia obscura]|uniref:RING-type domain-containing protein n=1 Tax=Physocladia obscura TaxID=109957 RepID=A0AAD5XGI4_9FUNG|nr:hypothetical protein HK100_005182 [Physocladia obscura]
MFMGVGTVRRLAMRGSRNSISQVGGATGIVSTSLMRTGSALFTTVSTSPTETLATITNSTFGILLSSRRSIFTQTTRLAESGATASEKPTQQKNQGLQQQQQTPPTTVERQMPAAPSSQTKTQLALLRGQNYLRAIVELKQRPYFVALNDVIITMRMNDLELGDVIELDRVREISSEDYILQGNPYVHPSYFKVKAVVIEHPVSAEIVPLQDHWLATMTQAPILNKILSQTNISHFRSAASKKRDKWARESTQLQKTSLMALQQQQQQQKQQQSHHQEAFMKLPPINAAYLPSLAASSEATFQENSYSLSMPNSHNCPVAASAVGTTTAKLGNQKQQQQQHHKQQQQCALLKSMLIFKPDRELLEKPVKTTLAQRIGIVQTAMAEGCENQINQRQQQKQDKHYSREEWQEIKEKARSAYCKEKEADCAICCEPFAALAQVILSCSHSFHKACIRSYERHVDSKR